MKVERDPYTHSPQDGPAGNCFQAQVWDREGKSVLCVEPTKDPTVATQLAERIAYLLTLHETTEVRIDGPIPEVLIRDEPADLMTIVEQILDAGHMDTTDLGRLRAAWERSRPDYSPAPDDDPRDDPRYV